MPPIPGTLRLKSKRHRGQSVCGEGVPAEPEVLRGRGHVGRGGIRGVNVVHDTQHINRPEPVGDFARRA